MANDDTYLKYFFEALRPDPMFDMDEWSDLNIYLPAKGAAEPGRYRTSRVPFLREIAKCLSPTSPIQKVVFMKSAQVGSTQLMLNWIAFTAATTPAPFMLVEPSVELAERVSKQKIAPMLEETPALKAISKSDKTKTASNTILLKEFTTGAICLISGANSPTGLRSLAVRFLALDEVDAYPQDCGGEGSPVELAIKRTTTFPRRKIFLGSTPTIAETSVISREYEQSDKRRYFVPCPHENCGALQWLKWAQVKWENEDPNTAKYECEHCHQLIGEHHKTWMLENGSWMATAPSDGKTAGFHISSLYSPIGWKSWAELVDEFLKAKGDAPLLKAFLNTSLGEPFHEQYAAKLGASELMARSEFYNGAPNGVLFITCGVDVQDDRLEISHWGWGLDDEAWVISHNIIMGDPAQVHIWKQVDECLSNPVEHESGVKLTPMAVAIDSGGHHVSTVYNYCRERRHLNYLAIKGQSQRGKPPIGKPTAVDINIRGQILKNGGKLYPVGTDTVKSNLFNRLKFNKPGPGYVHFPHHLPDIYYQQLTSEKQTVRYVKGFPVREWTKKESARNETLDCAVYATSALEFIRSQYNKKTFWQQMTDRFDKLVDSISNTGKEEVRQNKNIQSKIRNNRNSFTKNW